MQEWFVQFIWQAWLLTCFPPGLSCLFARTIFWGAEHQVLAPAAGGVRSIWCGLEDGISWDSFKSNLMVINYPAGWPSRKAVASLSNMYHKKYISIQPLGWLVPFLEVSIQDLVSTFRVTMHLTCSNRMLLSCMFFWLQDQKISVKPRLPARQVPLLASLSSPRSGQCFTTSRHRKLGCGWTCHSGNFQPMAVYEHDPVNTQSDENKTLRRYANLLRKSLSFDSGENISNVRWFFSWKFLTTALRPTTFLHGQRGCMHWGFGQQCVWSISHFRCYNAR
jgi:hypothetical protein